MQPSSTELGIKLKSVKAMIGEIMPYHNSLLFVGTNGHIRAIDKQTGNNVWETSLPGTGYEIVSLIYENGTIFAGSNGYVFALNAGDGSILWKNNLKGLSHKHMTLATASHNMDTTIIHADIESKVSQNNQDET